MPYFNTFNWVQYPDFVKRNESLLLKNITSLVVRKESIIDDKSLFYKYTMTGSQTIEEVSNLLYKTPQFYWVIMVINNRFDRFYDFPMTDDVFTQYIEEKYGSVSTAANTFKYFIRTSSLQYSDVDTEDEKFWIQVTQEKYLDTPQFENGILMKKEISLYDSELQANEEKRVILVIQERYLNAFVNTFANLMR
jgi:hypothetical protein